MKVTIERLGLLRAVQAAGAACGRSDVQPVLKDVMLDAKDDEVIVSGTDLELRIRTAAHAEKVYKDGRVMVLPKPLIEILKGAGGAEVTLEAKGSNLHVTAGTSRFKLLGGDADEFPDAPKLPAKWAEVEAATLVRMAHQTGYAVAHDANRYALNGLLMVLDKAKATLVATNGSQLAVATAALDPQVKPRRQAILDKRVFAALDQLAEAEDFAEVGIAEHQVFFRLPGARIVGQIFNGRFPPYDEVIPQEAATSVLTAPTTGLMGALRLAGIMAAKSSRMVKLKFSAKGMTALVAVDPEHGDAHVEQEGKFTGEELVMKLNPDFLHSALGACSSADARIEMWGARKAIVVREEGMTELMMPVTED